MSKSLGNFFTARDLLDQGVPGEVIRFVFLSTHYRKPMDWTERKRQEAEATLKKWYKLAAKGQAKHLPKTIIAPLAEDLNTHGALEVCHQLARRNDADGLASALHFLGLMRDGLPEWAQLVRDRSLGVLVVGPERFQNWTSRIAELAGQWQKLRANKDFTEADILKSSMNAAGIKLEAGPIGVEATYSDGLDTAKLEALK